MVHISTSARPCDAEPGAGPAAGASVRKVTLYMCAPRRQMAEAIDVTPDMTLHDVVRRSAHLHWLVGSREIDRLDVCVGGIPRHFSDRLGHASSVEVYPAQPMSWADA